MSDDWKKRLEEADAMGEDEIEILDIEGEAGEGSGIPVSAPVDAPGPAPAVDELEQARADLAALDERFLRLRADFDNYRKRSERERAEVRRYMLADPLRDLLPVLDNLERALASPGSVEDLRRGVEMIVRQLREALKRHGLAEVVAQGERFDPSLHEAVAREESLEVEHPTVVDQLQRGYLLHDRLLRPAMVKVAVPPEPAAGADDDGSGGEEP
jgi:molecular chaperone GrpE